LPCETARRGPPKSSCGQDREWSTGDRRPAMTVEAAEEGVSKQLVARFGDTIGTRVILREIATAESELRGQVPAAAMSEFVHRLAAIRLAERIGRSGLGGVSVLVH
jgi:hypothetical protein